MNEQLVFYRTRISKDLFECLLFNRDLNSCRYISSNKDNDFIDKIINIFSYKHFIFCGYNNFHHDDTVISYIIKNKLLLLYGTKQNVLSNLYSFSQTVIHKDENEWNSYKYLKLFKSIDIACLLMPKKTRVSFKQAECNLMLNIGDIRTDVKNLEYIYNTYCKDEIEIRKEINKEYKVNVLSLDSTSAGISILRSLYLKKTGLNWDEVKNKYTTYDTINFNKIIFDDIKFVDKQLNKLLEELKAQTVESNKKNIKKIYFHDSYITLGLGGLHSIEKPGIISNNNNERLLYIDINSMYPSIAVRKKIYPMHIKKEFIEIYKTLYNERIESDGTKRSILKWVLNSAIGMFNKEGSWLYDPMAYYKISINSQMYILMLADIIFNANAATRIVNWNTDGLFILFNRNDDTKLLDVINKFSKKYSLPIKYEEYSSIVQYNGNNYVTYNIFNNKTTGIFNTDIEINKFANNPIISKALKQYFIYGTDVETTIKSCKNIFDFCTYYKKESDWEIVYNNNIINTNLIRYYHAVSGFGIAKQKIDLYTNKVTKTILLSKNQCVVCDDNTVFPNNVDYRYYISKCKQIINEIENIQLNLF